MSGLIIPADNIEFFKTSMRTLRAETKMVRELKWTKVSDSRYVEYRRFVDYFFELKEGRKAHFHAIIVDTHKLKHHVFNDGDRELGFYKFLYQLLLHRFGKRYCAQNPEARLDLIMDQRTSSYPLEDLRRVLNNGLKSRHGIPTRPFATIEARDSKKCDVLQINDIILGAVGFQKNGRELLPDGRQSKKDLAAYIAERCKLPNLKETTPYSHRHFSIWNFALQ